MLPTMTLPLTSRRAHVCTAGNIPPKRTLRVQPLTPLLFRYMQCPWSRAHAQVLEHHAHSFIAIHTPSPSAFFILGWQTREVLEAMAKDCGCATTSLRVDGGMTANDLLMQIQADTLGVEVCT